jgi:hypothetical protein
VRQLRQADRASSSERRDGGQALVLVTLALVAVIAMTGLIVDGGNAWAQQRLTQNGTDSSAEAGALVLVRYLSGATAPSGGWDAEVSARVAAAAAANSVTVNGAWYTNVSGELLTPAGVVTTNEGAAAAVGVGAVPSGAQGVRTRGQRTFNTYLARIVGQMDFTTRTDATAVAGALNGVCDIASGCAIVPVTFPTVMSTCDGTGTIQPGSSEWPEVAEDQMTDATMSIVPLCKNKHDEYAASSGSVGWLDFGCPGTLEDHIRNPCPVSFDLPTWIQTKAGNVNSVEDAMRTWNGKIIMIPLFDGTCKDEPPGTELGDCTSGDGTGAKTWYHIPKFAAFKLHNAYIQGSNNADCNSAPGGPPVGGNGSNGCLKGWFTGFVTAGPVGPVTPGASDVGIYATQLIR